MSRHTTTPNTARATRRKAAHPAVKNRQKIVTGTLPQVRALLPKQPAGATVPHGSGIVLDAADANWRAQGPGRVLTRFADDDVRSAIAFIKRTGIVAYLNPLLLEAKKKPGRPCDVPLRALLVAMWLCARTGKAMLLRNFRDVLAHRITAEMKVELGLTKFDCLFDDQAEPDLWERWNANAEKAVGNAFHRMLTPIDPSIYVKNHRWPWEKLNCHLRPLTPEDQIERQLRLDWVCNQMLQASWESLPKRIRKQYRKADICVDATPMAVHAYGPSSSSGNASTDPDCGYYVRQGSHIDPVLAPEDDARPAIGKRLWGMEIHLAVAVDSTPGLRQHLPALALAMTLDRPGIDVAGNTRRILASILERGFKPGYLTGDRLYTEMEETTFQIPAREAGFDLVLAYKLQNLGGQATHSSGMVWADGNAFCPMIPEPLRDVSADLAAGKITLEQYHNKIEERQVYLMRTQQIETGGQKLRLCCPADGPATAMCARKPESLKPRPTRQADGTVTDARPLIPLAVIKRDQVDAASDNAKGGHKIPKVCQQQSVTVQPTDHAKYRQNLLFGTALHTDLMNMLRQSQEGLHGVGKDHAHEAIGSSGKRRVRGKAAQSIFAAFLLAAMNLRKIHTFLAEAVEDPRTGAIYRYKRPRKGDHGRTGVPPGIPPERVLGHWRNPSTRAQADQTLVTKMAAEAEAIEAEVIQRQRGRPRRHLP